MARGKDNFPGMRDSLNGGNNAAIVTVIRRHFEANMHVPWYSRLLAVPFPQVNGTQALWHRSNHDMFCACNTNSLAHCHCFRLFQHCSDSFHTILLALDGMHAMRISVKTA